MLEKYLEDAIEKLKEKAIKNLIHELNGCRDSIAMQSLELELKEKYEEIGILSKELDEGYHIMRKLESQQENQFEQIEKLSDIVSIQEKTIESLEKALKREKEKSEIFKDIISNKELCKCQ